MGGMNGWIEKREFEGVRGGIWETREREKREGKKGEIGGRNIGEIEGRKKGVKWGNGKREKAGFGVSG